MLLLLYSTGLIAGYFGDDFQWVSLNPASDITTAIFGKLPTAEFYRPLPATVTLVIQLFLGIHPLPIHLISLALHALVCVVVYKSAQRVGLSLAHAWVAAGVLLLYQTSAAALLGQDTFSQIASTSLGCFSLYMLLLATPEKPHFRLRIGPYLTSILLYTLSLFSKESGISFFLPISLVIFFWCFSSIPGYKERLWPTVISIIPFLLATTIYMLIRNSMEAMSPSMGSERYDFAFGFNIILNIAQLGTALVSPVSTVDVYTAFVRKTIPMLIVAGGMIVLVYGIIVLGILTDKRKNLSLLLCVLALLLCFPMALLNHVSELYAYNAMPMFSLVAAIGIVGISRRYLLSSTRILLFGSVVFLIILSGMHIAAIRQKSLLMYNNGITCKRLIDDLLPLIHSLPRGSTLVLLNNPCDIVEYSVYKIQGFNLLSYSSSILERYSGRTDITILLPCDEAAITAFRQQPTVPAVVLRYTCNGDIVRDEEFLLSLRK